MAFLSWRGWWMLAALAAPWTMAVPAGTGAGVGAAAQVASVGRVIVKYRDGAGALAKTHSTSATELQGRLQGLATRRGLDLRQHRALSSRMQVVLSSGVNSTELARRLSADADVEFAVPDRRMRRAAVPNDSLFASVLTGDGPEVGQWYLKAPSGEVRSSINAVAAWDVSTGSANVVVAVLDTGVRFDHPDLGRAAAGGKLLPGYDFVKVALSNDTDGPDADASDPGDFVTTAEVNETGGSFFHCTEPGSDGSYVGTDSSWHGTQVAGLVGALSNNGAGMAGTSWNARVLPVRVLGKCGGYQSDVIAGMRWAAGLSQPGVPNNPLPARVLNLSLGGPGACDAAYQSAIDDVTAAGALVVASAGNSVGHAVGSPANCNGVLGVGGLRHIGTKVGFSDVGPGVAISAPGGNCVNLFGACQYPILTTSNAGKQGPAAASYTDSRDASLGTSFSAPMVSGVAALVWSVYPSATPAQVTALLKGSAAPFPTTGAATGVAQCTEPQSDAQGQAIDQAECYCTTSTCGAGMLDAGAAMLAARSQALAATGVQALISVSPVNPVAGEAFTLDAAGSLLSPGATLAGASWSLLDGGGIVSSLSASTPQTTLTASAGGTVRVQLSVTDNAGRVSTQALSIYVQPAATVQVAADTPAPAAGGGGGGALSWSYLAALLAAVVAIWRVRRRRCEPDAHPDGAAAGR